MLHAQPLHRALDKRCGERERRHTDIIATAAAHRAPEPPLEVEQLRLWMRHLGKLIWQQRSPMPALADQIDATVALDERADGHGS